MSKINRAIVVYASPFDETEGGSIVCHRLVDRLNRMGENAYVYPRAMQFRFAKLPKFMPRTRLRAWYRDKIAPHKAQKNFRVNPDFETPIADKKILKEAIVVYSETVHGNPLKSKRVVRWLLHKPGFFRPSVRFGLNELTYFYNPEFAEGVVGVDQENLLRISWLRSDVYFDRKLPNRSGACRLIRKGKYAGLSEIPEDNDAILIDGMTHEETAEVFNKTKVLYSHDPFTQYMIYAAMCGCIPVVIPQLDKALHDQLTNRREPRWGIAYGEEEIGWALKTRGKLLDKIFKEQESENELLKAFVERLGERFLD
jgi:hypothetical protein